MPCLVPPPADAGELIAGLALQPDQRVRYREEVHHPALDAPEVATGTVFIAANGDLVRDQVTPQRQISEVGQRTLSTRPAPDAEATLYPIPGEVRPMLLALRRVLAGDAEALAADFVTDLSVDEAGWRLSLRPRAGDGGAAIAFEGCGDDLRTIEITQPDGVRRSLTFSPGR